MLQDARLDACLDPFTLFPFSPDMPFTIGDIKAYPPWLGRRLWLVQHVAQCLLTLGKTDETCNFDS